MTFAGSFLRTQQRAPEAYVRASVQGAASKVQRERSQPVLDVYSPRFYGLSMHLVPVHWAQDLLDY